jgi:hypothetical protein
MNVFGTDVGEGDQGRTRGHEEGSLLAQRTRRKTPQPAPHGPWAGIPD